MNDWAELLKLGLSSAMVTLTALGLGIGAIMPGTSRWHKRFFVFLFATIMLLTAVILCELLIYENPSMTTAEKIAIYLEYLLIPLPMPVFTVYLLNSCRKSWQKSGLFHAVIATWCLFFLLLGAAQFTTFLYYVTDDNQFCRGPWHPLLMAAMVMPMLINISGVVRLRGKLQPQYFAAFLIYLLPLSATLIIHTFFYSPELVFAGITLSALSMFVIILFHQIEQYVRQQREISHQRASIMVLEMRPHFIYNAMMSIYYLCAKNPRKAQQVTLDFTTYLRKNFTAIASTDTVPFSEELEHTRAYLAVEQVQFEDGLVVDYDTPHKEFRIPPLTLQPIVENAIKHGMDPECTPLHIFIRTRQTEAGNEIIVEDDGSGFAVLGDAEQIESDPLGGKAKRDFLDGEPHIALTNIRHRLSMMCDGKMTIQPREGGGTVIKVTIP